MTPRIKIVVDVSFAAYFSITMINKNDGIILANSKMVMVESL